MKYVASASTDSKVNVKQSNAFCNKENLHFCFMETKSTSWLNTRIYGTIVRVEQRTGEKMRL